MNNNIYLSVSSFTKNQEVTVNASKDGSVNLCFGTAEAYISLPRDVARKLASELEAALKEEGNS